MNEAEVTLAILAGGRGERMGKPKSLLRIGNQPILTYLLKQFAWGGPTMLVSSPGRENPPGADGFDVEVVDPVEGMGPVRGVLTAMENLKTETLVVASVDMPGIGRKQILWLLENLQNRSEVCGLMIQREKILEPFPTIFRKTRAGCPWYDAGYRSMRSLTKTEGFAVVPAPKTWRTEVWTNLNEPWDLEAFESYRNP